MKKILILISLLMLITTGTITGTAINDDYVSIENYKENYTITKNPEIEPLYVKSTDGVVRLNEFLSKLPSMIDTKYLPSNQNISFKEASGSLIDWCKLNNWSTVAKTSSGQYVSKSSDDAYPIGVYENIYNGKPFSYIVYMSDNTVNYFDTNPYDSKSKVTLSKMMIYPEFTNYFYGNEKGISNGFHYKLPLNKVGEILENDFNVLDKIHDYIDHKYHPEYNLETFINIMGGDIEWLQKNDFVIYEDQQNNKTYLGAKDAYPIAIVRNATTLQYGGNYTVYMSDNTEQEWSDYPYKEGSVLLNTSIIMNQYFGEKYGDMPIGGDGGIYNDSGSSTLNEDNNEEKTTKDEEDLDNVDELEEKDSNNSLVYVGLGIIALAFSACMLKRRA